jgi:hypothetical protein
VFFRIFAAADFSVAMYFVRGVQDVPAVQAYQPRILGRGSAYDVDRVRAALIVPDARPTSRQRSEPDLPTSRRQQ